VTSSKPSIIPGGRRFTVGFSFAGGDRSRVEQVARRLAKRLTEERVLYDKFHEEELARLDLDVYLPKLYTDETELIVVVLSPDYPTKRWCGLELRNIRELINTPAQGRIMLLQIGTPTNLSELGIRKGDGFLDISRCPADVVAEKILKRLIHEGIAIDPIRQEDDAPRLGTEEKLQKFGSESRPPQKLFAYLRRTQPAVAAIGLGSLIAVAWWGVRPLLAGWELRKGDQAFLAYTKLSEEDQLQRAGQAWRQALALNPRQPDVHARLGFLADILEDLPAAATHWRKAATLTSSQNTLLAQANRNGLANVLAQYPGQQYKALAIYDSDRFYPRSALEAAMQRWSYPKQMPEALNAISEPQLDKYLSGDGQVQNPWGFKQSGALLIFESRADQRCLLANVRAATIHLAGNNKKKTPPLDSPECKGISDNVRTLICSRLESAKANSNYLTTLRWFDCPKSAK
jgi:hypothetical protein